MIGKFNEPRIHFALCCGAWSSPRLPQVTADCRPPVRPHTTNSFAAMQRADPKPSTCVWPCSAQTLSPKPYTINSCAAMQSQLNAACCLPHLSLFPQFSV
jgi:Protein of unknown function, DUF547